MEGGSGRRAVAEKPTMYVCKEEGGRVWKEGCGREALSGRRAVAEKPTMYMYVYM